MRKRLTAAGDAEDGRAGGGGGGGGGGAAQGLGVNLQNTLMELRKIANHPLLRCATPGHGLG